MQNVLWPGFLNHWKFDSKMAHRMRNQVFRFTSISYLHAIFWNEFDPLQKKLISKYSFSPVTVRK